MKAEQLDKVEKQRRAATQQQRAKEANVELRQASARIQRAFGNNIITVKPVHFAFNLAGAAINLWAGFAAGVLRLSPMGRNALAATLGIGAITTVTIPVNANHHAHVLGHTLTAKDVHPACHNQSVWNGSEQIAAFAITHYSTDAVQSHAYRSSMIALQYGVDPRALYSIGHFETGGFRDVMAKETSATNPWQFVDSTKLAYIYEHGKNVIPYIEAKQRIAKNTGSDFDHQLVGAFESITGVNRTQYRTIQANLRKRDLTGPQLDALRFADIYAGHLLALDIKKKAPELRINRTKNKSTHALTTLVAQNYYPKHHFLGLTNFTRIAKLARIAPNAKLSDFPQVKKTLSESAARSLKNIAARNPGLLSDRTAPQALNRITSHFTNRTMNVWEPSDQAFKSGKTTFQMCVTNSEKLNRGPIMASQLEVFYAATKRYALENEYMSPDTVNNVETLVKGAVNDAMEQISNIVTPKPQPKDPVGDLLQRLG